MSGICETKFQKLDMTQKNIVLDFQAGKSGKWHTLVYSYLIFTAFSIKLHRISRLSQTPIMSHTQFKFHMIFVTSKTRKLPKPASNPIIVNFEFENCHIFLISWQNMGQTETLRHMSRKALKTQRK